MFTGIARFELRYQLKNPVFWVSCAIFFLLGFGLTASENVSIGTPGSVHENSPFAIAFATAIISTFYLFVITSFVANAIIRDDQTGFGPILRSTSITRSNFLLGRFFGGLMVALIGYLAVPLGMGLGVMMPWVDPETVGPGGFMAYAWHYLILAVPNIFLASAFLFGLATITRSMVTTYIGVIIFIMGYLVTTSVLSNLPEYQTLLARYEPLGVGAISEATRYWTADDMNSRLLPLSDNILFNRILALGLGAVMLGITWWRFSLTERAPSKRKLRKLAKAEAKLDKAAAVSPMQGGALVQKTIGVTATKAQFLIRLKTEVTQVLKSPGFAVLLILAIFNTWAALYFAQSVYGTTPYPLTANVITTIGGGFTLFLLIIAVFYGGELVWRERDRKFNEIIDATPVANWVMFIPKILAIFLVLLTINTVGMIFGILFQSFMGADTIAWTQYLAWFVVPQSVDILLVAILAVFVQVLSPNKYIGWGLMLIWFVSGIFLRNLGYNNILYLFARGPAEPLSDMNGAGNYWIGGMWARFYWLCFAAILMAVAHLIWPRGTVVSLRPRLANIRRNFSKGPAIVTGLALFGMIGSGVIIYDNIKNQNIYRTSDEQEKWAADFEKKYLKFEKLPKPVVTDVKIDAQIFPKERRLTVVGHYMLRNDGNRPITDVHIMQGDLEAKYSTLKLSGAKLARYDKDFGYRIFQLDNMLQPGETLRLDFQSEIWRRGFTNNRPATDLVDNGSFINNFAFAPVIGINRNALLQDRTQRRRQGLPAELRPAKLEDISAQQNNYVNADWVNSDILIATDADQVPIAPGNKMKDETANGRRTAHFISPAPILNFYSLQSARYTVAETEHDGVKLSVYYHPDHHWNVPIMQKALATSLDYYQQNFGPYQFNYARIVEFPGYASFAQAFAGTMPYSESIGFAANVSDPDSIDYVSYVTAHELGHQYWAHQVIGADMQGGTLTSETLAQYSALMVMKKLYGPDKIRRFLKYELDRYLTDRKSDVVEELPLYRVENQPYIHYRKGALVMYLLQERLGEAAVNKALSDFVAKFRFKGAPYLRSTDLIDEFRKQAKSPADQALITDLFEKITIYDLKASEAKTVKRDDGLWETNLEIEARKYYADGKGAETETILSEPIEIGLFTKRPGIGAFAKTDVISIKRYPVKNGIQTIKMTSKVKPLFTGIDPYNFYIDRDSDDNIIDVGG